MQDARNTRSHGLRGAVTLCKLALYAIPGLPPSRSHHALAAFGRFMKTLPCIRMLCIFAEHPFQHPGEKGTYRRNAQDTAARYRSSAAGRIGAR